MQVQVDNREFKEFSKKRPGGARGAISYADSIFLHSKIQNVEPKILVEIGIAAGISSATLLYSMQKLNNNSQLYAFDLMENCFFDLTKEVGFAVEHMINKDFAEKSYFKKVPSSVFDFHNYFDLNSIDFMFIDANHRHPWPCIDLFASLPYLKEGSTVCLHDINLPQRNQKFPNYGVKNLFDKLDGVVKDVSEEEIPNCGSIIIKDKENIREQIKSIYKYCNWEEKLQPEVLSKLETIGLLNYNNQNS